MIFSPLTLAVPFAGKLVSVIDVTVPVVILGTILLLLFSNTEALTVAAVGAT